jgi:hypothetical protein
MKLIAPITSAAPAYVHRLRLLLMENTAQMDGVEYPRTRDIQTKPGRNSGWFA